MLQARGTAIAAAALVLAAYVSIVVAMPKYVFWSPDEGAKFIQALTLRWDDGLEYVLPYAARSLDPELEFYPSRCRHNDIYPDPSRGQIRLHWPIWFPLAAKGLHAWFGVSGLYLLPLVSGWLVALACGWFVYRTAPRLAALAILVVGLASPIFFYSLCFWEHTPATLLGLGALFWVAREPPGRPSVWLIAAALLGAAIALRVEMVAFGVSLVAAWGLASWRARAADGTSPAAPGGERPSHWRLVFGCLALAIAIVGVFAFVLTPRHWESEPLHQGLVGYVLGKSPALLPAAVSVFVNAPGHQAPLVPWSWELLVLCALAAVAVSAVARGAGARAALALPGLLIGLGFSIVLLFWPRPYISLHGFFPIAPYAALAAYGAVHAWRNGPAPLFLLASTAAIYLVLGFAAIFTFFVRRDGGYLTGLEWGARNLLTLYPLVAILALAAVDGLRASFARLGGGAAALVAASVLIALSFQLRGVQMLVGSHRLVAAWQAALPTNEPIFTDVWWLPAAMAPFFAEHGMLCATDTTAVGRWAARAPRLGVRHFTFARLGPLGDTPFASDGVVAAGDGRVVSGLHVRRFRIVDAGS